MTQLTEKQQNQEAQYLFPYHYLDLASDHHKLLWTIEYLDLLGLVKKMISPFNNQKILDVGCGDGRFCYELKKENAKIAGVDFSEKAISFARVFNPEVDFFVQDIKNLNVPMKFDVVILMETLEHFIPSEIPVILSSLSNILKEDGKIIITVPSKNLPLAKKHYQHFTAESLTETLKPYFKIMKISGYGKTGYHKKIFSFLRKIGYFVFPFINRISLAKRFFIILNEYYKKHLSAGKPEACNGLIAVCVKNR
ncbi:MAG: type 12 methyltransferase [Candidatus Peregrinibacteria bacterium GW2011_GWC2_33_13]|nr:MAG: type 12 methyltransferase [Candidatus Peregrinibacteria bacterium GW2011_GWC2_33_13]